MSERTERSEGREAHAKDRHGMSEHTERSEGREGRQRMQAEGTA